MPTAESICDSRTPVAHGWSWTAIFALSLFVAVPAILILFAAHSVDRRSHPTDEELTASFLAHESDFQTLTLMLDASYLITGDRPIKGRWFIHHDMTVAVAFAPY